MSIPVIFGAILLLLVYIALLFYYRQGWQALLRAPHPRADRAPVTRVSVIIPARNESANILACLRAVSGQAYPSHLFEVIVVDDFSTDDTAAKARSFPAANLRVISLSDHISQPVNSYKKKAIETAVAQATGTLIVTTDADCIMGANWLRTLVAYYEHSHPAFLAAPVLITAGRRCIEQFQQLDFLALQGITGAAVQKGFHSMCNGANLAYEKTAFEAVGGFRGIDAIASGDDMLLMHKIAQQFPGRIAYAMAQDVIVKTLPQSTIKDFIRQRIRWASKADKYTDRSILPVLLLVYLLNMVLLFMPFLAVLHWGYLAAWIILLLAKTIMEIYFLLPVAGFFGIRTALWRFPLFQFPHVIYTVLAGGLGKFGRYRWKDREVR